ncbi:hypothetical protein MUY27_13410 [Mucilaginibacter sp. RS28]|uniref:Uncharacterized protein n=1 Tax=Mucilaginibacter straminoryzae TaxID=2932774 RepID=A0A9X1X980_9SPHI|nr:hypothetical protein [Mucilaginibacter straminoryzae]MCJ8210709.1 hypothetical protein [Mucilaginibacter straminoryzae]
MLPKEVFNRRHHGTPWIFSLIVVDAILVCFVVPFYAHCAPLNWFFWIFIAGMAAYNAYTIYFNREDFGRINLISYLIFIVILIAGILLILNSGCGTTA